jgi:intein/homing endonuclease
MKDVLDLFGELPDYPGKTKPKNRVEGSSKKVSLDDPFKGVPKRIATIGGVPRELYTVGSVGKILGRSATTIRKWERKGWIPAPTYRTSKASGAKLLNTDSKGYRLYSREQVDVLLEALTENNLTGFRNPSWQDANNWVSFIHYIKANWPK